MKLSAQIIPFVKGKTSPPNYPSSSTQWRLLFLSVTIYEKSICPAAGRFQHLSVHGMPQGVFTFFEYELKIFLSFISGNCSSGYAMLPAVTIKTKSSFCLAADIRLSLKKLPDCKSMIPMISRLQSVPSKFNRFSIALAFAEKSVEVSAFRQAFHLEGIWKESDRRHGKSPESAHRAQAQAKTAVKLFRGRGKNCVCT